MVASDLKIGDRVEYTGVYSAAFPHVGIVEKIDGCRVTIRLDESITHINVYSGDVVLKGGEE